MERSSCGPKSAFCTGGAASWAAVAVRRSGCSPPSLAEPELRVAAGDYDVSLPALIAAPQVAAPALHFILATRVREEGARRNGNRTS